ncbi:unnamed protein product [Zymoseptoria tritici ST99CH_1A5]|uniref:Uncharacterized protein n=1 Tax=Zymoseptoria tritici ST99CH_1A5 TaxID=1276529 RepID=A0A1Y6LPP9_ZYMTR|nr:unnamed protein product [Zymoseptoria tritici ST99CH_1A5]
MPTSEQNAFFEQVSPSGRRASSSREWPQQPRRKSRSSRGAARGHIELKKDEDDEDEEIFVQQATQAFFSPRIQAAASPGRLDRLVRVSLDQDEVSRRVHTHQQDSQGALWVPLLDSLLDKDWILTSANWHNIIPSATSAKQSLHQGSRMHHDASTSSLLRSSDK